MIVPCKLLEQMVVDATRSALLFILKGKILRYLLLTYYKKADGQIDEVMSLAKNLKTRDHQLANVILDFKELRVIKASMSGSQVPKDWDRIVGYYHQHYAATIERLFKENGYEIVKSEEPKIDSAATDPG